jgi:hypothetical protein
MVLNVHHHKIAYQVLVLLSVFIVVILQHLIAQEIIVQKIVIALVSHVFMGNVNLVPILKISIVMVILAWRMQIV